MQNNSKNIKNDSKDNVGNFENNLNQSNSKIFEPKIIMIGMPDMANVCLDELLKNGFNVIGLIPPHTSNNSRNAIIGFAKSRNINVYEFKDSPNEKEFIEKIAALKADLGLVCSFDFKLSENFLKTTKNGYINCHPSMLPDYRGANPYFHIIKNGERVSGLTLHLADNNFDTGNIVLQEAICLDKKETMGTLFNRTNFLIAGMLVKVLKKYVEEKRIQSAPQIGISQKKAPIVPAEIKINWQDDAVSIERLIRASNPFFNCITFFRGTMLKVVTASCKIKKHSLNVGIISKITKDGIEISAAKGYIYPNVVQIGTWGIYDIREFIEKFKPIEGEILK